MVKFRTSRWNLRIEEVEIKRQTLNSVWLIDNTRRVKMTQHENYFDTKAEAKAYFVNRAQLSLDNCHRRVRNAEKYLATAKAIKIDLTE